MDNLIKSAEKSRPYYNENMVEERKDAIAKFKISNLTYYPKASSDVLEFIGRFLYHGCPRMELKESAEVLRYTFHAGYCYYFASMLKDVFKRGEVCWAAPFSHIIWVDSLYDIPYDVEGVYCGEAEEYIPISWLGEHILGFQHFPGYIETITKEEIDEIISRYREFRA